MKYPYLSTRAKRILLPVFAVGLALFIGFLIHMLANGGAAFPGGKIVDGRYFVEEHGKTIEFTRGTFLFSYFLGIASTATIACFLLGVFAFYWTGDLRNETRNG